MYLPQHPDLRKGLQLQQQGLWPAALACYQQVESENLTESLFMQGFWAYEKNELEKASLYFHRVIAIDHEFQAAYVFLANILFLQSQFEAAMNHYQYALKLNEEDLGIWKSIAKIHAQTENWQAAINALGVYLKSYAEDISAWKEMADYYHQMNWTFHQNICYERILALEPGLLTILERQANILWHLGIPEQTYAFFNKVLQLDEAGKQWFKSQAPGMQQEVLKYQHTWQYFKWMTDYAQPELDDKKLLSATHTQRLTHHQRQTHKHLVYTPERKLKIGYLSREFEHHSSTRLIWPLLAHHTEQIEVFGYNDGIYHQPIAIKKYLPHWRDVYQLDNPGLAAIIQQDQIDILVDLGGLSHASRYGVYALHPAPIQITGLGFVFSSLCPDLDYCFSDDVLCQPELETLFPEQVIYLKSVFHLQMPPEYEITALPCLKNGFITMGSANSLNKLNMQVLQLWVQALKRLPDSRLILKTPVFNDPLTRNLYLELFESLGIKSSRITLFGQNHETHLTHFYSQIDIALDPFPYQGGVTTCDALWMGVPVVCMLQETWRARALAASILSHIGLADWLVHSEEAYIARILQWAQDIEFLKTQRQCLRDQLRHSVICDGPGFAHEVEAIYQELALRHLT